ncbi:Ribosome production factor 1 [Trichoplax sp. H2]|nr:Ribosome production factor 1 [Trichoplax sp. H2]|eukprot:RDD36834.1 Ribosome production factor 1 [Trichoplax sp. H2]
MTLTAILESLKSTSCLQPLDRFLFEPFFILIANSRSKMSQAKTAKKSIATMMASVKNKDRKRMLYHELKLQKQKEKKERKKKRIKEEKEQGDDAPAKKIPRTIENSRVHDVPLVDPNDEEVIADEKNDKFQTYFNRIREPKVLITTSLDATLASIRFIEDWMTSIPNAERRDRKKLDLKSVVSQAMEHDVTDVIIVNEDRKKPNRVTITHLPDGPTACFRLSNYKPSAKIKGHGSATSHKPEVILNNFTTRLGHSVARMLASLFPFDPQFKGRNCVTFHNQRDFIFFRFHRYLFKNKQKVSLQELGPRFTLKLLWLKDNVLDCELPEYEWMHKQREMTKNRRKFQL